MKSAPNSYSQFSKEFGARHEQLCAKAEKVCAPLNEPNKGIDPARGPGV
jgi:hypothetical protein